MALNLEERRALSRCFIDHLDWVLKLRESFMVHEVDMVSFIFETGSTVLAYVNGKPKVMTAWVNSPEVHLPILQRLGHEPLKVFRVDLVFDSWKPRAIVSTISGELDPDGHPFSKLHEINLTEDHLFILDHLSSYTWSTPAVSVAEDPYG